MWEPESRMMIEERIKELEWRIRKLEEPINAEAIENHAPGIMKAITETLERNPNGYWARRFINEIFKEIAQRKKEKRSGSWISDIGWK